MISFIVRLSICFSIMQSTYVQDVQIKTRNAKPFLPFWLQANFGWLRYEFLTLNGSYGMNLTKF